MTQQKQAQINAKYLAKKLVPVYKILDWKWADGEGGYKIPDEFDIYETLMHLYEDSYKQRTRVATDGLYVETFFDEEEIDTVEFGFEISESMYVGYEEDEKSCPEEVVKTCLCGKCRVDSVYKEDEKGWDTDDL